MDDDSSSSQDDDVGFFVFNSSFKGCSLVSTAGKSRVLFWLFSTPVEAETILGVVEGFFSSSDNLERDRLRSTFCR